MMLNVITQKQLLEVAIRSLSNLSNISGFTPEILIKQQRKELDGKVEEVVNRSLKYKGR